MLRPRVDTDEKGLIEHLIFSDIQNTGVFLLKRLNCYARIFETLSDLLLKILYPQKIKI